MKWAFCVASVLVIAGGLAAAEKDQRRPRIVAVGDSLTAGVQSGDANLLTQPASYANLVAAQAGVEFPLPLVLTNPFGSVVNIFGRFRLDPTVESPNLAVSGFNVVDLIRTPSAFPVDTEADLMLYPRWATQVEIVEKLRPDLTLCWVGGGDALKAIIAIDQYDASQLTPLDEFMNDFNEVAERIAAASDKVVFANIPGVERAPFLMSGKELRRFTGSDYGLEKGSYTSVVVALAVLTGLIEPEILEDPNYVLDAMEVAEIRRCVRTYNAVIAAQAAALGAPVVDVDSLFTTVDEEGLDLFGYTLTTQILGGVASPDGLHPSNTTHAIIANEFIREINSFYRMRIPLLSDDQLALILATDPSIDKDGDGRLPGRPFVGLLETLLFALGYTGDFDDLTPDPPPVPVKLKPRDFLRVYGDGTDTATASRLERRRQVLRVLARAFGGRMR